MIFPFETECQKILILVTLNKKNLYLTLTVGVGSCLVEYNVRLLGFKLA